MIDDDLMLPDGSGINSVYSSKEFDKGLFSEDVLPRFLEYTNNITLPPVTTKREITKDEWDSLIKDIDKVSPQSTSIATVATANSTKRGDLPRGLRNNNPGNIRLTNIDWKGKVANNTDGSFELFSSMPYGYRAMFMNLQSYFNLGIDTISAIISKWAPKGENKTERYIAAVVKDLGIDANQKLDINDAATMLKLAASISRVENGQKANMLDVAAGWKLFRPV